MNDFKGMKFGKLTILERCGSKNKRAIWKCICDCGNYYIGVGSEIKSGGVKSCGCLRKKTAALQGKKSRIYFSEKEKRLKRIYDGMKARCYNKNSAQYLNYGGKGIKIFDLWLENFNTFKSWAIANGYKNELTLDRIDNDKGYEPQNCRWSTYKVQENNRSNNRIVSYEGKKYTLSELSNFLKISGSCLAWRIKNGWKEHELSLEPNLKNKIVRRKQNECSNIDR